MEFPMIADVFLNYVLDQATLQSTEIDKPKMIRYVDDLFLTFSAKMLQNSSLII